MDFAFADQACAWGIEQMRERKFEQAIKAFDEAIAAKPNFAAAMANKATALMGLGRFEDAIASFDRALMSDQRQAAGWYLRGNALVALRRLEDAVESYSRALALQPDLIDARENREMALYELKRFNRVPAHAVRALFDEFAANFDDTMLNKLNYRGHLHLRALAERVLGGLTPGKRILDLGCGTGLVGEAFKDAAVGGRLDGIDLAPRMLEAAVRRGIYSELILGDIETVLHERNASYELILSADTMVYFGDLAPTFGGVAKRLRVGGFYLFLVESKSGTGWEQTSKNRYRHSKDYLRSEAERAGLEFADLTGCSLRNDGHLPVSAFVVALKKPEIRMSR